jgi:hypothetical protein
MMKEPMQMIHVINILPRDNGSGKKRRHKRHVRLGLASDGVSPHSFGRKGRPTSVWPVVVMNYNLLPWLSMKKGFLLLSLIIPGPMSQP